MSSTRLVKSIPASHAVVERVAACEDVEPTELDPLYEVVDPEAVDRLAETTVRRGSTLEMAFSYHGHDVTVTGEGVVHIGGDGPREQ